MKKLVVLSALLAATGFCAAQEMGRVISSTPVTQQVAVPRQVCNTSQVISQPSRTGAGAAIGAIAGGAMGNTIGNGGGRALATVIGLVGGAMVGDRIEGSGQPQVQNVQQCGTQTFYENRTVGYNVVYEYAGKQYSVQMPNDPGPDVRLQVTPVGTMQSAPVADNNYAQPADELPVVVAPTYLAAPVVYPGYYPQPYYQPYYSPVGVSLNFGYYGGHFGRHHWR